MKPTLLVIITAFGLGVLAGCERNPNPADRASSVTSAPAGSGSSAAQPGTPATPANSGTASQAKRQPGTQPPVQGREDVRQPEQRRDFQQKGDSAGPKP